MYKYLITISIAVLYGEVWQRWEPLLARSLSSLSLFLSLLHKYFFFIDPYKSVKIGILSHGILSESRRDSGGDSSAISETATFCDILSLTFNRIKQKRKTFSYFLCDLFSFFFLSFTLQWNSSKISDRCSMIPGASFFSIHLRRHVGIPLRMILLEPIPAPFSLKVSYFFWCLPRFSCDYLEIQCSRYFKIQRPWLRSEILDNYASALEDVLTFSIVIVFVFPGLVLLCFFCWNCSQSFWNRKLAHEILLAVLLLLVVGELSRNFFVKRGAIDRATSTSSRGR